MSQEPINIAGVCAFPNPNGVRDMRFVDCNYNTLFRLPNHSSIIMTKPDGTQMKQQCSYIDDYHIYIRENTMPNGRPSRRENRRSLKCSGMRSIW